MKLNISYKPLLAVALLAAAVPCSAERWIDHIGSAVDDRGQTIQYISISTEGQQLAELVLESVSELTLYLLDQTDLLPQVTDTSAEQIVSAVAPEGDDVAYRVRYRYTGDEQASYSPLSNGVYQIHYWTDVMGVQRASTSSFYAPGAYADRAPDGQQLRIGDQLYAKGLCIPNGSNFKNTRRENLRGYVRFKADGGFQYGSAGYNSGTATLQIASGSKRIYDSGLSATLRKLDIAIGQGEEADPEQQLSFWNGRQGKTEVLGAARLYAEPAQRPDRQIIEWQQDSKLILHRPAAVQLTATATSGQPVGYRVVEGRQYASVDGDRLNIFQLPDDRCDITVEAYQPGSHTYSAAQPQRQTFDLIHSLLVKPGERVVLDRDESLDEIIIKGNSQAVGQVVVDGAIIKARRITFKYTFVPGQWNHLVFPSDIDLDQASDLGALGYTLNNQDPQGGGYFVQRFDTRTAAENPEPAAWRQLDEPRLKGRTGYVIMLTEGLGTEPVEVTFSFDNEQLSLDGGSTPLLLSLDLSRMQPYTTQDIYVRARDVAGNTLKVAIDYRPTNPEALPVNHAVALEQMRVTVTPDGSRMRLTLPTQEAARVALFDSADRLVKAVSYIAPNAIDISDLQPGTYTLMVRYGNATVSRELGIRN